jgi:hypothetical protein
MAKRYNPPPNWPQPPAGWSPPEGWKPDPAWGPAPAGWDVWVDEPGPAQPVAPRGARRWPWLVATAVAFVLGLVIGGAGSGDGDGSVTTAAEPGATVTATAPAKAGPTVTKTATVTAKPPGPEDTIEEGDWEVGADVKPGTYKTVEPIEGDCYWKISPIGRPDDIIDNDIVTGGRPTVILKKGQQFTNQGCGTWGRQ